MYQPVRFAYHPISWYPVWHMVYYTMIAMHKYQAYIIYILCMLSTASNQEHTVLQNGWTSKAEEKSIPQQHEMFGS